MSVLDFGSIVVCNNDFTEQTLCRTIDYLASCGIRRIIFTYDYNCYTSNITSHIDKLRELNKRVKKCKKRGVTVKVISSVASTQTAIYDYSLSRLSMKLKTRDYIFLDLPLFADKAKLDSNLNYLIHRQQLFPVFTSFEKNIITGNNNISEHILKTPGAVFLFDVNFISRPGLIETVKRCIQSDTPMLLCLSDSIENYIHICEYVEHFKTLVGKKNYSDFLGILGRTSNIFFGIWLFFATDKFPGISPVFLFRGFPAPQMPFLFVLIKHLFHLKIKSFVDPFKVLCNIFMYRAFADPEFWGDGSYRGFVFDKIRGKYRTSFFTGWNVHHINALHIFYFNKIYEGLT